MVYYFISNSKFLTTEIIDRFNFKPEDCIFLFNKIKINIPRTHKLFSHPNLSLIQRNAYVAHPKFKYKYIGYDNAGLLNINKFYLFGNKKNSDYIQYRNYLLSFNNNRNIHLINIIPDASIDDATGDVGKCFDISLYTPYTGTMALMYFDHISPSEEKVLIGFTSYTQEKDKKRTTSHSGHHNYLDKDILLSYCLTRPHITLRYCCLKGKKLCDTNIYNNFIPIGHFPSTIDIENPKKVYLIFDDQTTTKIKKLIDTGY